MIPVVDPDRMRAVDAAAPVGTDVLVERAGAAVARVVIDVLGGAYGRRVAVIAGPGNNGADGRVAAERLRERGLVVTVHDARDLPASITGVDLVVDAAFGSGFRGSWTAPVTGSTPVVAVDLPTGLDGRTGEAAAHVLRADVTVTFAAPRPGHLLGRGPDVCGEVLVADIGLDVGPSTVPDDEAMYLVESADVAGWLPGRPRDAHKWNTAVRVVAGSAGMTGAARLAAAAAGRAGAGMVVLSSPGTEVPTPPEIVGRAVPIDDWAEVVLGDLDRFHALVIGPGLGRAVSTLRSVSEVVAAAGRPVVVDGDGLAVVGPSPVGASGSTVVLTPHDGEFTAIVGRPPGVDRVAAVRDLARATGAVVLLKGPTTLVAGPGSPVWFVANGDQRLATAGTGDVLAGIVGALLARGLDGVRAATAAAWLHAEAARTTGRDGLVAGDLVAALPAVFAGLVGRTRMTGARPVSVTSLGVEPPDLRRRAARHRT